eukprot:6733176-Karenia_brevis.AAC.1
MPTQVASVWRRSLHILVMFAAKRSPRMRSGQWIGGVTGRGECLARLACQYHHQKGVQQRLCRTWLSTAVRHATTKSEKANIGQEIGVTGTGPFLAKIASPLRPAREAVDE